MNEQRQFHRVLFEHGASLTMNNVTYTTEIIDLSLKGALIAKPDDWSIDADTSEVLHGELRFSLAPDESEIVMQVVLAHQTMLYLGLKCELVDVDSATMLRRIIELNSSDPSLLQRDLSALVH